MFTRKLYTYRHRVVENTCHDQLGQTTAEPNPRDHISNAICHACRVYNVCVNAMWIGGLVYELCVEQGWRLRRQCVHTLTLRISDSHTSQLVYLSAYTWITHINTYVSVIWFIINWKIHSCEYPSCNNNKNTVVLPVILHFNYSIL